MSNKKVSKKDFIKYFDKEIDFEVYDQLVDEDFVFNYNLLYKLLNDKFNLTEK